MKDRPNRTGDLRGLLGRHVSGKGYNVGGECSGRVVGWGTHLDSLLVYVVSDQTKEVVAMAVDVTAEPGTPRQFIKVTDG